MFYRVTSSGNLKSYRFNLQRSAYSKNQAQNTVMTGRAFNSFAEDPALAARCFQLRRSFQAVDNQMTVTQSVVRKYEIAWDSLGSVSDTLKNEVGNSALSAIISGNNAPVGAARTALGEHLIQKAESIVQTMNVKYGDNFVFSGADGLSVPFSWGENGELLYRGISVDKNTNSETLDYLATQEHKFADIGLGLQEVDGKLVESSAYDTAFQGITFLGYGEDADGDPKNVASILRRMGEILTNCDENGRFQEGEQEEYQRLFSKFETASATLTDKYVEMDTQASFLKEHQEQLALSSNTLQEQIVELEQVDQAEAITAFSWAQYCYNAALKVGNSILSESLMDYMNT